MSFDNCSCGGYFSGYLARNALKLGLSGLSDM
jgi:hypothetical protein